MNLNSSRLIISLTVLLSTLLATSANAQIKTFQPGDVIKSSEINENFEYLKEQIEASGDAASAQCSAKQDGSNVVISCSDGSSAVLAGAGTVVTYPEGGIYGESPTQSWPSGDILYVDAAGTTLARAKTLMTSTYAELGFGPLPLGWPIRANFYNDDDLQIIRFSNQTPTQVYYQTNDCSGQGFTYLLNGAYDVIDIDGSYYIADSSFTNSDLLFESRRFSAVSSAYSFGATGQCTEGQFVAQAVPVLTYTPAYEILNAVYPFKLEQLP